MTTTTTVTYLRGEYSKLGVLAHEKGFKSFAKNIF